jgi:hypothetical protein
MERAVSSDGSWRVWARGCLVVLVVLVAVGVLIGGWVVTIGPVREAIEARETLAVLYGPQEDFTPPLDGAVPVERMEAFLAVRERLAEPCARLTEASEAVEFVNGLEWAEVPPKPQAATELWRGTRRAIRLEARRGEFFRARNQALLEAEMGLGEYSYLFAIAYGPRLARDREAEGYGLVNDLPVLPRIRALLVDMLRRQLAAVEASPGADREDWARELTAEIARLDEDPRGIPWMDGLPPQIAASVAPYRQRLDELACEDATSLELMRNEKSGLGFHGH